jgi:PAS domain S-box-containing protein
VTGSLSFRNVQQTFILRLNEALRPLSDPLEIQATAASMLGHQLNAERAYYHEIDAAGWATSTSGYENGDVKLPNKFRITEYGEQWLRYYNEGHTVAVEDTEVDTRFSADERISWAANGARAGLGVPIMKDGNLRAILGLNNSSPRLWSADDIALAEDVADRTWDAVARARAEHVADERAASLRSSERKYRTLFENIDTGFCIVQMKFDANGHAVDYRLEELNPAFEKQTGLYGAVGKWVSEVVPGLEPHWFEAYGQVAKSGNPVRFENYAKPFGRWFDVYAHPTGDPDAQCVAIFFHEITQRKQAEATLQQSEERQAYLLELSDRLRPIASASQIKALASEFVGQHLNAARVAYFEVDGSDYVVEADYSNGVQHMPGRYPVKNFGQAFFKNLLNGILVTASDCGSDPELSEQERASFKALEIGAYITVPLVKDSQLIAGLSVHSAQPRNWTHEEILRVAKAAERTWAAVERALAEARLRFREEELARTQRISGVASIDIDLASGAVVLRSPEYCLLHGLGPDAVAERHEDWLARLHPEDRDQANRTFQEALAEGEDYESEYRIIRPDNGETRWISAKGVFYRNANQDITRLRGAHIDITDRKHAEAVTREAEMRFRLLVDTMPQLVWKAAEAGKWTWASLQWREYTGQTGIESHGHGWLEPIHPDDRDSALIAWAKAAETGFFQADYRLFHHAEQSYRWFHTRALPVRNDHNDIIEWVGTSTDVDDLRTMGDRMQVLVAELQHRTRNLLGVVNATMSSTLRDTADLQEFSSLFRRRLHALARVNALLSRQADGERLAFDELIKMELEAVGALDESTINAKIELDGPTGVRLRSGTVQTFALAIHELATNAVKYGALAQSAGQLSVRWKVNSDLAGPRLHLVWHETGVRVSRQQDALGTGYGRELIERALPYQLQAETFYEIRDDGVCCTIDMPISTTYREEHTDV